MFYWKLQNHFCGVPSFKNFSDRQSSYHFEKLGSWLKLQYLVIFMYTEAVESNFLDNLRKLLSCAIMYIKLTWHFMWILEILWKSRIRKRDKNYTRHSKRPKFSPDGNTSRCKKSFFRLTPEGLIFGQFEA